MQGALAHGGNHQLQVAAVNAANNGNGKTQRGGQRLEFLQQLGAVAQTNHQHVSAVQPRLQLLQGRHGDSVQTASGQLRLRVVGQRLERVQPQGLLRGQRWVHCGHRLSYEYEEI